MTAYYAAVICAIVISTIIILIIQYKLRRLKLKACLAIAGASLISASAMPAVYYVITMSCKGIEVSQLPLIATIGATGVCLLLGLIFGIVISHSISSDKQETAQTAAGEASMTVEAAEVAVVQEEVRKNNLEQIYETLSNENSREMAYYAENSTNEADNLEISVDSSEITDKISIDNYMQDSENLTLEDCIAKAWDLREQGESEAAVQYFMYALDRKPDKDLTFWIVLDICILYKNLGQRKLAEDILNSYYDSFSDIMDESVKEEIRININEVS